MLQSARLSLSIHHADDPHDFSYFPTEARGRAKADIIDVKKDVVRKNSLTKVSPANVLRL